jgi:hypothetical protein
MSTDTFTGIFIFNCIKNNTHKCKYTIIQSQCPDNYKLLEHFKKYHDLNNCNWINSREKAKAFAILNEQTYSTQNGIVIIDYTHTEPIEMKIMYSSEFNQLISTKYTISSIFTYFLHFLYLIFMIKLIQNLYY